MPFCPQCRYEYQAGLRWCSDCGAELVDELSPEEQLPPSSSLVTVYIAQDMLEANVVKSFLDEARIEAFIGYDLGSAYPFGSVEVRVAEPHAEEARDLIAEFLAAPEEDRAL